MRGRRRLRSTRTTVMRAAARDICRSSSAIWKHWLRRDRSVRVNSAVVGFAAGRHLEWVGQQPFEGEFGRAQEFRVLAQRGGAQPYVLTNRLHAHLVEPASDLSRGREIDLAQRSAKDD